MRNKQKTFMKIWIVTDTHFNHPALLTKGRGRPADYEARLWESLEKIPEGDTLIHLGDLCMGRESDVMTRIFQLKCSTVLVKGNHDTKSDHWYYQHGFDFVCREVIIKSLGRRVLLSHKPQSKQERQEEADIHVHGHLHGVQDRPDRQAPGGYDETWHYDAAPDNHGFKAVPLEWIIQDVNRKKYGRTK